MQYFGNILVQISPNDNKLNIFEIYTKRGVGNSFGGHPVLSHIFKIKDQKQKKITKPVEFFFGSMNQNVIVLVKLWHIF